MQIFRATASLPPIVVLHGLPGIGKTTLGQNFPTPVFLQNERIPIGLEIATFGLFENFSAVIDALRYLGTEPHEYRTLVIDSLDKLEPLIFSGGICQASATPASRVPATGKGRCKRIRYGSKSCAPASGYGERARMMIVLHRAFRDRHHQ